MRDRLVVNEFLSAYTRRRAHGVRVGGVGLVWMRVLRLMIVIACLVVIASGLDAPILNATAKGPNQVNLRWSPVANPGYGFCVEIQSNGDSRYSSFTQLNIWQAGSGPLIWTPPVQCLPYWVTEFQYVDPQDSTPAQYIVFGLLPNTTYNFRVRSFSGYSGTIYSSYSNTVTATTSDYNVRYVAPTASGSGNGTSITNAWTLAQANANARAGQVVLIEAGTYNGDIQPANGGTSTAHKLVFEADAGATVTLNGTATITQNYTVIDGINFTASSSGYSTWSPWIIGHHNVMANTQSDGKAVLCSDPGNLRCSDGVFSYSPHLDRTANYTLLQGNWWHDVGANQGGGDLPYIAASNVVSVYNHWSRGAHDTTVDAGIGNRHLNNLMDGGEGAGIYFRGSRPLLEGNVIAYVAGSTAYIKARNNNSGYPGVYKDAVGIFGQYVTMRRNLVLNCGVNPSTGAVNPNSCMGVEINGSNQGPSPASNAIIYNNVFYNGGGACIWFANTNGGPNQANETIANNICDKQYGGTGYSGAQPYVYLIMRGVYSGSVIHHNDFLFRNPHVHGGAERPRESIICIGGCSGYSSRYRPATDNTTWPQNYHDNYAKPPGFVMEGTDFHLNANSLLRGAGAPVTDRNYPFPSDETDVGAFKYFPAADSEPSTPK